MTDDKDRLRGTFDEAAQLYDRARPGYPEPLIEDVISLSGVPPGGRILEIGCGTGQATVAFARRGYRILAIELGENLAAVARHNLEPYPEVEVRTGTFEEWSVEEGAFDLVVSATAFHWIDPAIAYPKAAQALKPGGALALFWNFHLQRDARPGFFEAAQELYRREAPEMVDGYQPFRRPDAVPELVKGVIEPTGLFGDVTTRPYLWEITYDARGYIDVLNTYSGHRKLEPAARERLFRGIAELIDAQFGDRITKHYHSVLYVAHRLPGS